MDKNLFLSWPPTKAKFSVKSKFFEPVGVYEIITQSCIVVNPELGVEYVARLFAHTRIRGAPAIRGAYSCGLRLSTVVWRATRHTTVFVLNESGDRYMGIVSVSDIFRKGDFVENSKSNFELHCEENPSAPEARIYVSIICYQRLIMEVASATGSL